MGKPSYVLAAYFSLRNLGILQIHSKPAKVCSGKPEEKEDEQKWKLQKSKVLANTAHSHPHFIGL